MFIWCSRQGFDDWKNCTTKWHCQWVFFEKIARSDKPNDGKDKMKNFIFIFLFCCRWWIKFEAPASSEMDMKTSLFIYKSVIKRVENVQHSEHNFTKFIIFHLYFLYFLNLSRSFIYFFLLQGAAEFRCGEGEKVIARRCLILCIPEKWQRKVERQWREAIRKVKG